MIFLRIDYLNTGLDYDYTICPFSDLVYNLEVIQNESAELTDDEFNKMALNTDLPEIKITLVNMSEAEYEKWFEENVESEA